MTAVLDRDSATLRPGHRASHDGDAPSFASPVGEKPGAIRKQARRREKAESRIRLHEALPPEPWERFRILSDCIKEARQVVDLADHRARYALIIVGVLNAGVLAVTSRGGVYAAMPPAVKPWLVGVLMVYGVMTVMFVLHAIDSLRPRPLEAKEPDSPVTRGRAPSGLLFWEAVARQELEHFHESWDRVSQGQINREAEAMFHAMSSLVLVKHYALRRLYRALVVLVLLAAVLLGGVTWFTVT